jgi:UvrD-like helicase C-terminal domain
VCDDDSVAVFLAHRNTTCDLINARVVARRFPGWAQGMAPPKGALVFAHKVFRDPATRRPVVGKHETYRVLECHGEVREGPYQDWRLTLSGPTGMITIPCLKGKFSSVGNKAASRELGALDHGMAEVGFGYGLTVHKSQSGEWDKVALVMDHAVPRGLAYQQWLYTAVTRARQTLVIAR